MIRVLKSGVQVYWTCSVVHKNELYVYGGDRRYKGDPYQIAKARFPKKSVFFKSGVKCTKIKD